MALSSPGIGSNLDVNSIVSQLMSIERQPLTALDRKEAGYQAKLSAYGTLKGALSSFQNSVRALSDVSKFQSVKATPADATVLGASASSIAVPGAYSVEVSKLAQSQKLAAVGQASTTSAIGIGTLTFDFGTISGGTFDAVTGKYTGAAFTSNGAGVKTVTIDASSNSLTGIRDAINSANIGVSAAIVNDGGTSPYRLALTSTSIGKTNSIKISVAGDAALSTLLAHDPAATQNLSETATAQNAEFKVDGVAVSKTSNSVSDVIQGVTLSLLKTNVGAPTVVTVARDTASVTTAVNAFVKAYNDVNKTLGDLSAYNATTQQAAILQGDSSVRSIQSQIRNTLTSTLAGIGGSYTTLSQIGVSFQTNGTLAVDSTKLQSAIGTNFNDIASLFAATGKATDSLVSYSSGTANTKPGAYALTVSQLATQGKVVGSAAAGLTIDGTNDTLSVIVDGVSATVTLAAGTYTAAALATEVQSKINGASAFATAGISVAVTQASGTMTLTSNRYGSASNASVAGNGAANLLGATPTATTGVDVAGTINGAAATGSGQYLTGATGIDAEGLKVLVSGGALGSRGTVNYSQGYAYKLDKQADSLLSSTGPISSRTDGINQTIKDIGNRREVLSRRMANVEKRYRAQFTALDTMISSMTRTSNFLSQQLSNLPKIS
ncbi:MAG: flagellar filament capping protein FliD [Sulfuricella sp.]